MQRVLRPARRRSLTAAIAAGLVLSLAPPALAAPSGVVIDELRFRGPLGGNDEFIELRNTTSAAVDISGWNLFGSNQTGSATSVRATVPANTSLPAGARYLFGNNASGGAAFTNQFNGVSRPTPDVTYGTGIADQGGVQLRNAANVVQDAVGQTGLTGAGLAFREGAGLPFSTSNPTTEAAWGRNASSTDTDNNPNDFTLAATGSPTPCGTACSAPTGPTITPIHDIQGAGSTSPKSGQTVTIEGVVTGIDDEIGANFTSTFPEDAGVFVQAEASEVDANPATSEGIFVGFVRGPGNDRSQLIGKRVRITGQAKEKFGMTMIAEATGQEPTVLGNGTIPAPVALDQAQAEAQTVGSDGTRAYYEQFEGMNVTLPVGIANSGGTTKFSEVFLTPGTTKQRVFRTNPAPSLIALVDDAGAGDPNNPYVRPDSATLVKANRFARVENSTGPLAFSFTNYDIVVQEGALPTVTEDPSVPVPYTVPVADEGEARIASFNVENLFPEGADLDLHTVTAAEYDEKLDATAIAIGDRLRAPEVVTIQEIGDSQGAAGGKTSQDVADDLAARIGGYTAYVLEGNDNRGIDVGFLIKDGVTVHGTARQVAANTLTAGGLSCGDTAKLFDRPPLAIDVTLPPSTRLTILSNHFASKSSVDACRVQQAAAVRQEVESLKAAGTEVLVTGDLNAFEDESPLVELQQGGTLTNLWSQAPEQERYSFAFQGRLQTLDHALITDGLASKVTDFRYAHFDNDYAQDLATGTKPSDHDPPVVTLRTALRQQSITFGTQPAAPTYALTSYEPTATGGASGNPVEFSIDPASDAGVCSLNAGTVEFAAAGTCILAADQAGDASFASAHAEQEITVLAAPQEITFGEAPADPTYALTTYAPDATGGASGEPVVLSIDGNSDLGTCSLEGDVVVFNAAGTCIVRADQAGNAAYEAAPPVTRTIQVQPAPQVIELDGAAPTRLPVGTDVTLSVTQGPTIIPATFSSQTPAQCSVSATGVVTGIATGGCSIVIAREGDGVYAAAERTVSIPVVSISTIAISVNKTTVLVGAPRQMAARATWTDGVVTDVTTAATWTSSDPSVISVSQTGLATAVLPQGTATITANIGTKRGRVTLTAEAPALSKLSISVSKTTVRVGTTRKLVARATYVNGATADVSSLSVWTTSDPSIISIDQTGLAAALLPAGTSTITASHRGARARVTLTAIP